jgi:23S rRNA (adenine2030-N6)-methyltransferase
LLSYRHAFHAGNFADVFKHIVLCVLLKALARKDKPFCYIDTHSGAGRYTLSSAMAQKNREFKHGIARLWPLQDLAMPQAVADYLAIIRRCNEKENHLHCYPGSPLIARHCIRSGDRLLLTELHPGDYPLLSRLFAHDPQVSVRQEDGYQALQALTPPHERRGLVLLDPAYERRDEIKQLSSALLQGYRRWQSGCFVIWYPIMPKVAVAPLRRQLQNHAISKILQTELCLYPDDNPTGLNGSGLLIINPPWQCDEQLTKLLPWLWRTLSDGRQGRYKVEWLAPE